MGLPSESSRYHPSDGGVAISKWARARDLGGAPSRTAQSPRLLSDLCGGTLRWSRARARLGAYFARSLGALDDCISPGVHSQHNLQRLSTQSRLAMEMSSTNIDEITAGRNDRPARIPRAADVYAEAHDRWVGRARAPDTAPRGRRHQRVGSSA